MSEVRPGLLVFHPIHYRLVDGVRYWACSRCGFERQADTTPDDIVAHDLHEATDCPYVVERMKVRLANARVS